MSHVRKSGSKEAEQYLGDHRGTCRFYSGVRFWRVFPCDQKTKVRPPERLRRQLKIPLKAVKILNRRKSWNPLKAIKIQNRRRNVTEHGTESRGLKETGRSSDEATGT